MAKPGDFTRNEILSQPAAWESALGLLQSSSAEIQSVFRGENTSHVIFTGCGSTYYLSLATAAIFSHLTGQLLAFERSLAKGLNPDRPAHLEAVVKLDNL